jgi:hypothetical protein
VIAQKPAGGGTAEGIDPREVEVYLEEMLLLTQQSEEYSQVSRWAWSSRLWVYVGGSLLPRFQVFCKRLSMPVGLQAVFRWVNVPRIEDTATLVAPRKFDIDISRSRSRSMLDSSERRYFRYALTLRDRVLYFTSAELLLISVCRMIMEEL